jgi:TrmH family RNA methyltransferase
LAGERSPAILFPASALSHESTIEGGMLSALERAHLTVVLVGARNPGNIGAAARALHDFGFSDLRVVNDFAPPFEAAHLTAREAAADLHPSEAKSAVHAAAVLAAARRYDTLAPALEGCTLIVGTTAIGDRELKRAVLPLKDAAPALLEALHRLATEAAAASQPGEERPPGRVALLFGSEKTGLTKEQLSHCSLLTTIPMFAPLDEQGQPTRHLSMNLGQSIAVCLYELTRAGFEGSRAVPFFDDTAATFADRERLAALLERVMQTTGYTRRYPHSSSIDEVRKLSAQLATGHSRAMTWMGLLRQVLRSLGLDQPDSSSHSESQK